MLHNLHYAGFIIWGVNTKGGEPPVIAEGRHEPIVSKEEFDHAVQVLASKFRDVINPRQVSSEYMLTSMLRCGLCGEKLTGLYSKEARIRYYVCTKRKHHAIAGCELPFVNVQKCDSEVLGVILEELLAPENLQTAIDLIAKELSGPYEQQTSTVSTLEGQIRKVQEQQERVMQAYEAGAYSVTDFAKRIDPLRRSEDDLAKKKADAESELNQQAAVIAKPQMVLDFAKDVGEFIRHSSAKERKQVLKKFIKTIWVYPGRVKIIYSIPLPRDAGKSSNPETEPGPEKDPVSPSALLSPHKRGVTHSRVIEIDPDTNEIAWEYRGDPPISFYSYHISGAERQPNGNTLICEGAPGRIFEVTPGKEIVWEYINPFMAGSGYGVGGSLSGLANSVFRAHRYGYDHPALQGKHLNPDNYANLNRLYS